MNGDDTLLQALMRSPGLCTIWGKELWAGSRSFFQGGSLKGGPGNK